MQRITWIYQRNRHFMFLPKLSCLASRISTLNSNKNNIKPAKSNEPNSRSCVNKWKECKSTSKVYRRWGKYHRIAGNKSWLPFPSHWQIIFKYFNSFILLNNIITVVYYAIIWHYDDDNERSLLNIKNVTHSLCFKSNPNKLNTYFIWKKV